MTRARHNVSRRTLLAAGTATLAVAAPASYAATRAHQASGLRVTRIGLAALSLDPRPASLDMRGVDVELLAPNFDDAVANAAFHAASLAGHIVGLDCCEPDRIAARAQAAGVRLFRDHIINGERLIQLDPGVFGVRLEIVRRRETAAPAPDDAKIKGLVAACDDPERAAKFAGAILGVRVGRQVVDLGACRVTFVGLEAANGVRGLREVHLDASQAGNSPDVTLAGVTWRCCQTNASRSLVR